MDPSPLTASDWAAAGSALKLLWLSLAMMFAAALSLGFAHAIIPSAVDTGTMPPGFAKARPVLYILGILAVLVVVLNFVLISGHIAFIEDMYPRWYR